MHAGIEVFIGPGELELFASLAASSGSAPHITPRSLAVVYMVSRPTREVASTDSEEEADLATAFAASLQLQSPSATGTVAAEPEGEPAPPASNDANSSKAGPPRAAAPGVASKARGRAAAAAVNLAAVSAGNRPVWADSRCYAVWRAPGAMFPVEGVHIGPNAWMELSRQLTDGRYMAGRDHLQGFDNVEAALAAYRLEAHRHNAPAEPVLRLWP